MTATDLPDVVVLDLARITDAASVQSVATNVSYALASAAGLATAAQSDAQPFDRVAFTVWAAQGRALARYRELIECLGVAA